MSAHPLPAAAGAGWDGGAVVAFHDVTAARDAARQITRSRDLFSAVLDAATELAIISTDLEGRVTVFNVGAELMLGHPAAQMLGRTAVHLHEPAELAARAAELGLDLTTDHPSSVLTLVASRQQHETRQWTFRTAQGRRLQAVLTVTAMRDRSGAITGYMSIARDISAQVTAAADLADSEQRFRLAFDTAPVGMLMVGLTEGAAGTVLRVNPSMAALLGHDELDLLSTDVTELLHPDDVARARTRLLAMSRGELERAESEERYVHADGSTVWVRVSSSVVRPHDWEPYALSLVEDITARKQAEDALTHQALHDALTGLPNRVLFGDRLEHALAASGRTAGRVGVLYLDLDGFKAVNDSAGHAAGDELLQQVAERIGRCIRPGDTLARLGGDEFAVVCPGIHNAGVTGGGTGAGTGGSTGPGMGADVAENEEEAAHANLRVVADRILAALREPVTLTAGDFGVGASIGMTLAGLGALPAQVLQQADEAMYGAKRSGKGRAQAHDAQAHTRGTRAARLLPQLRDAVARDELVMHGQPVVDLATGAVVAVETLIRWQHPTRGLLAPVQFLDVAEASPLMIAVGRRVLDESCRLAAVWAELLGPDAPSVHVNVSARQLDGSNLCDDVMAALDRHGLPGHQLGLEL
ncbi:MAG TPA: diguanylate cyclase, partial [Actinomycetales bacterium]